MKTNCELSDMERIGPVEYVKEDDAQYDHNSQSTNL